MRLFLALLLIAAPAGASNIALCLPSDPTVPDRVGSYIVSANTANYLSDPDALINPDVGSVQGIEPLRYWKCDRIGNAAIPMSAGEKSSVDAADAAALDTAVRDGAKDTHVGFVSDPLFHRAMADILKDEINILRGQWRQFKIETAAATSLADFQARIATLPDLDDRTLQQLLNALDNRIDSGSVD